MASITRIHCKNFLSLNDVEVELGALNVLVGPNGAGKSNLLKVFQFIGEVARRDLLPAIDLFGGFDNLVFRGRSNKSRRITLEISGLVTKYASQNAPDDYELSFWQQRYGGGTGKPPFYLVQRREKIVFKRFGGRGRRIELSGGSVDFQDTGPDARLGSREQVVSVQPSSSGLAILRRLGADYDSREINNLAAIFEQMRVVEVSVVEAQKPAARKGAAELQADASNLAAYLLWLRETSEHAFENLVEDVRYVLPGFEGFHFEEVSGTDAVRVHLQERGLSGTTPLAAASFGTVRAIALFAILHDPEPPKLTCLEEVDHGLHPYALDRLVERLREASTRTQVVVATHSPALVNRLRPEDLIIFERADDGSTRRVDITTDQLRKMQEESGYGLGELWFSGTLGGVP